jgi:hypothetical protein
MFMQIRKACQKEKRYMRRDFAEIKGKKALAARSLRHHSSFRQHQPNSSCLDAQGMRCRSS